MDATPSTLDGRYGDEALLILLREAAKAGCAAGECEFKIFGGGFMLGCDGCSVNMSPRVNERNIEQALALAEHYQLNVIASHVGGGGHRQIRLDLSTGDVWLRHSPLHPKGMKTLSARCEMCRA